MKKCILTIGISVFLISLSNAQIQRQNSYLTTSNYDAAISKIKKLGAVRTGCVSVTITSNQDNGIVAYWKGEMKGTLNNSAVRLQGTLDGYFSDRNCEVQANSGTGFNLTKEQPFCKEKNDMIELTIESNLNAKIVNKTWGNAEVKFKLQRIGNLLYGITPGAGKDKSDAVLLISFQNVNDCTPPY